MTHLHKHTEHVMLVLSSLGVGTALWFFAFRILEDAKFATMFAGVVIATVLSMAAPRGSRTTGVRNG